MGSILERDHYRGNIIDSLDDAVERIVELEGTELSGVAGPQGPEGPEGPEGPPGPGSPSPLIQGDILVVDSIPEITTLAIGSAHEMLKVNAGGTDPAWEAFDWDEMSGVAGADMAHDHSSAAEGGQTLNVNGQANAIVLDADGDTSIGAPIDDEINVEVGSIDVAKITGTGIYQLAGNDLYPNGNEAGAQYRFDAYNAGWDYHFDFISALPGGFAWAGAPFVTPSSITYDNSRIQFGSTNAFAERMFLYRSGSPPAASYITQVLVASTIQTVGSCFGIRWDDGSDNNYLEAVINQTVTTPGAQQAQVKYRTGGGAITTVTGSTFVFPTVYNIQLRAFGTQWSSWYGWHYLFGNYSMGGRTIFRQAQSPVATHTWTPTRYGVIMSKGTATYERVDIDAFQE